MKRLKQSLKCFVPVLLAVLLTFSLTSPSLDSFAQETTNEPSDQITQTETNNTLEGSKQNTDIQTQDQPTENDSIPPSDTGVVDPSTQPTEESTPPVEEALPNEEALNDTSAQPVASMPFYLPRATSTSVPEHHKSIQSNLDGTYKLTLDIKGKYDETHSKPSANIVLVIDKSGSMNDSIQVGTGEFMGYPYPIYDKKINVLKGVVNDNNGLVDAIFRTDSQGKPVLDAMMSIVSYSGTTRDGTYNDAYVEQDWSNQKSVIKDSIQKISPTGGTNCQAGLRKAKEKINALPEDRKKMSTYVIFMSDGVAGYYYDTKGNTIGSGSGSNNDAIDAANKEAANLGDIKGFYTIGFGPGADSDFLNNLNVNSKVTTNKHFTAATKDKLIEAFTSIAGDVNKIELNNVTITDTLSTYVEPVSKDLTNYPYTVSVKDASGNEIPAEVEKAGIQCAFDGTVMKFTFKSDYVLKQDYTYSVSFDVKPSQAACDYYKKYGKYPNDAGFNSNGEAKVDYVFGGVNGSATYESPTFKFDTVEPIKVTKVWKNSDGTNTNYKEDSVQVDLVQVDQQNKATRLDKTVTLNDINNWTHTWDNLLKYDYSNDQITEIHYEVRELQTDSSIVNNDDKYIGDKYTYKTSYLQGDKQGNVFVENVYQPSSLTVTKKVYGVFGDAGNTYRIKISLTDLNGNKVNKTVKAKKVFKETNSSLDIEFIDGVGYVDLKHNESVELKNLGNVKYLVEEVDSKGHEVSIDNKEGTLKGTSATVTVTNTKNGVIDAGIDDSQFGFMGIIIGALSILLVAVLGFKRRYS